jgi:hypothetical protein
VYGSQTSVFVAAVSTDEVGKPVEDVSTPVSGKISSLLHEVNSSHWQPIAT